MCSWRHLRKLQLFKASESHFCVESWGARLTKGFVAQSTPSPSKRRPCMLLNAVQRFDDQVNKFGHRSCSSKQELFLCSSEPFLSSTTPSEPSAESSGSAPSYSNDDPPPAAEQDQDPPQPPSTDKQSPRQPRITTFAARPPLPTPVRGKPRGPR